MKDGLHFHWRRLGTDAATAPPVLMLHGFMGNGEDWEPVAQALRPACRCFCPDLPGHGDTGKVAESGYTMPGAAKMLVEDMEQLGLRSCALVGYSMGGRLALYLAVHYPAYFQCLVLESASPGLSRSNERKQRRQHDETLAFVLKRLAADRAHFRVFLWDWYRQPIFLTLERAPGAIKQLVQRRSQNDPKELAASLRGMGPGAQPSLWKALPAISLPTLLLAGAEDHKFCQLAEAMDAALPHAAVETLEDCSHNIHFEAPKRYATVLSAFLHAQCHKPD